MRKVNTQKESRNSKIVILVSIRYIFAIFHRETKESPYHMHTLNIACLCYFSSAFLFFLILILIFVILQRYSSSDGG
jgi:hypothetical protein